MTDLRIPGLIEQTDAGIFADHLPEPTLPLAVAPTGADHPKAHNVIRKALRPMACANLAEYNFRFDCSMLDPRSKEGFRGLTGIIRRHPACPMSLFGHADPSGDDLYNKHLSERRARATFAVLSRKVAIWEDLYSHRDHTPGDDWGLASIQVMLDTIGYRPGNMTGQLDPQTRSALEDARLELEPQPDGRPVSKPVGSNTAAVRKKVFARYMDAICPNVPGPGGQPLYPLAESHFLGGYEGKGTLQGCSEFNPILLTSQEDERTFKREKDGGKLLRDLINEPNRRLLVFFFPEGTRIDPARWPCPRAATQGAKVQGCRDRFWTDGDRPKGRIETRFEDYRRRFGETVPVTKAILSPDDPERAQRYARRKTTFGCRFYQGIAGNSPCEGGLSIWVVRLMHDAPTVVAPHPEPRQLAPVARRRFVAKMGPNPNAPVLRGFTTDAGFLYLPVYDDAADLTLRVDRWGDEYHPEPAGDQPGDRPAERPGIPGKLEPWKDEGRFVPMELTGAMVRVSSTPRQRPEDPPPSDEEKRLGAAQRFYDLGYGSGDWRTWTDDEFNRAMFDFERAHPPAKHEGLTDELIAKLLLATQEYVPVPQPDPEPTPAATG